MKPPQFFITLILASICVVLSLISIWHGISLNTMQSDFQKQQLDVQTQLQSKQGEINRGNQIQQVYSSIIKDIASVSFEANGKVKNEKLKELLSKNGITVSVNQPTTPAAPTPKP